MFLARWSLEQGQAPDLAAVQWWTATTWGPEPDTARALVRAHQTEFSVSRVGQELWMVSTEGFGAVDDVVRTATVPEGPWSVPRPLYLPPEFGRDDVLVYSAKIHPHITGALSCSRTTPTAPISGTSPRT